MRDLQIGLRGDADGFPEGGDHLVVFNLAIAQRAFAAFNAARGFHDDPLARLDCQALGVEIINFAHFFEADADNARQWMLLLR